MTNHLFFGLNQPSYYPGKPIDGVIIMHVQTPVKVKRIGVEWEGVEFVSWWQGVSHNDNCTATKSLFKELSIVLQSDEPQILDIGTHSYNVSWDLPAGLSTNFEEKLSSVGLLSHVFMPDKSLFPKSFGDEKSYIRYGANAFAEIENAENPLETYRLHKSIPFRIVEDFDYELISQPPIEKEVIEKPLLLFGGNVKTLVRIANGGNIFTGLNLILHISVDNNSNRKIDRVTVNLYQNLTFSAPGPKGNTEEVHRRETVLNAIIEESAVLPQGKFERDISIPIPNTVPGSIRNSEHIRRDYEISVDVEIPLVTTISIKNPILLLEWSPLLKGEIPEFVINIHPNQPLKKEDDNTIIVAEKKSSC